jgi:hypothetical protein
MWEATLRPTINLTSLVEHGILLLKTKEGVLIQYILTQDTFYEVTGIGFMRSPIWV